MKHMKDMKERQIQNELLHDPHVLHGFLIYRLAIFSMAPMCSMVQIN